MRYYEMLTLEQGPERLPESIQTDREALAFVAGLSKLAGDVGIEARFPVMLELMESETEESEPSIVRLVWDDATEPLEDALRNAGEARKEETDVPAADPLQQSQDKDWLIPSVRFRSGNYGSEVYTMFTTIGPIGLIQALMKEHQDLTTPASARVVVKRSDFQGLESFEGWKPGRYKVDSVWFDEAEGAGGLQGYFLREEQS